METLNQIKSMPSAAGVRGSEAVLRAKTGSRLCIKERSRILRC